MIKKEAFFLVIAIILLSGNVLGAGLEVTSQRDDSRVFPGSETLFKITVKNDQIREDFVRIDPEPFSVKPFSDIIDEIKISPRSINIPSGEERNFDVIVKYSGSITPEKTYTIKIIVKSVLNEEVRAIHPLASFIMSSGDIISMKPFIKDEVIPGKEIFFDVEFKNNVKEDFNDLNFFISTSRFNKEEKISIKGKEVLTKIFSFFLEPETPAGREILTLRLMKGNSLKGERQTGLEVRLHQDIIEKENRESGFLSTKVTIIKQNNGNVDVKKTVKYPLGIINQYFTDSTPEGNYKKDETGRYLVWDLNLGAGQESEINIEIDYTSMFFALTSALFLLGLIYFVKNRTLRIKKTVYKIKEGDKDLLKIILNIQNNSSKNIKNMKVVEILPSLVKHYSDFGTLKPDKIMQGSAGVKFVWDFDELYAGEERVLSYKAELKTDLYGKVRLPAASIQYAGKENKLVIRRSNMKTIDLRR